MAAGNLELTISTELSKKPSLEPLDSTALTEAQQQRLNDHKVRTRVENEQYLRKHPEVTVLLSSFLNEVLLQRPEDIKSFASDYFTSSSLPDRIKAKMKAKT